MMSSVVSTVRTRGSLHLALMERRRGEMRVDLVAAREQRDDGVRLRHRHRVAIEAAGLGRAVALRRVHLHRDRRDRHLDGRDGDLVRSRQIVERVERRVRVFRYIGSDDIAATPRTSTDPRVRSHSVMKAGGPAAMKSTEPDSSASFMTAGPPRSIQRTVSSVEPGRARVLLDQRRSRITNNGRKPTPPAPSGIRTSLPLPTLPPQPATSGGRDQREARAARGEPDATCSLRRARRSAARLVARGTVARARSPASGARRCASIARRRRSTGGAAARAPPGRRTSPRAARCCSGR